MSRSSEKSCVKPKLKPITMNIPVSLYEDVKELSYKNGITITSQFITLCNEGLKQDKALELLPQVLEQLIDQKRITSKSVKQSHKK